MATAADVLDLVADLRSGSVVDRARAATTAFRTLAALSPEEKRDLAVLVAERTAPHLVPRIREETGLDLTGDQVQTVLELAGRLDADDLAALRRSITDPQARQEALERIGETVSETVAEPAEPGPVADQPGEFEPDADESALEDAVAPEPVAVQPVEPVPEEPPPEQPAFEERALQASAPFEPEPTSDDRPSLDSRRHLDELKAVPDGWKRRRAIQRLLDNDALDAADVPAAIRSLERPMARAWIAATAVESGLLDLASLDDLLDPRSAARLRRRYG